MALIRLTKPQWTISTDPSRFRVACCGRRFGKTFLAMAEAGKFSLFRPNQSVTYVNMTHSQAREQFYIPMKTMLARAGKLRRSNDSRQDLHITNNSIIRVRSGKNYENLRGGKNNFLIMDEVQGQAQEAWSEVLGPTLADSQGSALFIGTPKGMGTWFYDMWSRAASPDLTDWSQFTYTTLQGGNVRPSELEMYRRMYDEQTFKQEFEADWVTNGDRVFYNWGTENIQPSDPIPAGMPIYVGMDFNNVPMTAIVARKYDWGFHIFDEIQMTRRSHTGEMAAEIKRRYPGRTVYVMPDATGSRTNTNSNGVSDHMILKNAGFQVITGKTNPNVNDSINAVNSLILNGSGERNLRVDPRCAILIKCIMAYSYHAGTRQPIKDDKHDHMTDALRYLVYRHFPLQSMGAGVNGVARRVA